MFAMKTGERYFINLNMAGGRLRVANDERWLAMDIGTTHLKSVVWDARAFAPIFQTETPTPYHARGGPSATATIDAQAVLTWVVQQLMQGQEAGRPLRMAFSTAMHTFLPVDQAGDPWAEEGAYTWMDGRSAAVAERLRHTIAQAWQAETGTPVHAMSVAVKWVWWREAHRNILPAHIVGLKDWLVYRLSGQWLTDWACASATGMVALGSDDWDRQILTAIDLEPGVLPRIGAPETELDTPYGRLILGGGDAAMAHFGLGVVPGCGAGVLSLGTSGALRAQIKRPPAALKPNFFCYRGVSGTGYLLGEAYSNVGSLLAFIADWQRVSVPELITRGLRRLAAGRTRLPRLIPFAVGERSPYWRETLRLEWRGVQPEHQPDDFMAATMAALLTVLYGGSRRLRASGLTLNTLRSASRLLAAPELAQWVANATGFPLSVEEGMDASLAGALRMAARDTWQEFPPNAPRQQRYVEPTEHDVAYWEENLAVLDLAAQEQLNANTGPSALTGEG